jgi:fatty-acyl-CoA synthase
MAGFPYLCLLSGSDMVLPSSIYNPKRLLIFKKEKKSQRQMASQHLAGVYHAMKQNPRKN